MTLVSCLEPIRREVLRSTTLVAHGVTPSYISRLLYWLHLEKNLEMPEP